MNAEQRKTVGESVKEARTRRGWYQKDLAEAAGITVNTVRAVETGASVQPGTLRKVLDALGIDPLAPTPYATPYPADVELVRDLVGLILIALPPEERPELAHDLTRYLMTRQGVRQNPPEGS